jgi:hypothetical protein
MNNRHSHDRFEIQERFKIPSIGMELFLIGFQVFRPPFVDLKLGLSYDIFDSRIEAGSSTGLTSNVTVAGSWQCPAPVKAKLYWQTT